jgi:hypothetical protein
MTKIGVILRMDMMTKSIWPGETLSPPGMEAGRQGDAVVIFQ